MRHVHDIQLYLIYPCVLDDECYFIYLGKEKWNLTKGFLIVAKCKKASFYILQAKVCSGEINIVEKTTNLWHRWLGHLSEKELDTLFRHNLLLLKGMHLRPCTHYLYGKQYKLSFHKLSSNRRSHVLDLICTNICTITIKILGSALYLLLLLITILEGCELLFWNLKTKCSTFLKNYMLVLKERREENWDLSKQIMVMNTEIYLRDTTYNIVLDWRRLFLKYLSRMKW